MFFIKKLLNFFKTNAFILCGVLGILSICSLFLTIFVVETKENLSLSLNLISYFETPTKFSWTLIVTLAICGCGIIFSFLSKVRKEFLGISAFLFILTTIFFALAKSFYKLNENVENVSIQIGLILAIVFSSLASLFSLIIGYIESNNTVRDIAEQGMLIAMAFVLNLIKLFEAPGGGSVNLQMLPLFLLALRHGPINGLISGGIVYGMITCLTDGWGIQFYPFDYLLGFGSVAIVGLFKNYIFNGNSKYNFKSILFLVISIIASSCVRFLGGILSSMIYYYNNDAFIDGLTKSLIYNVPYIFISAGIALIAMIALYPVLAKLNNRYPTKQFKKE